MKEKMPSKGNILSVDDSEDICEILRDLFHEEGYQVDTVQTGADAIALVEQKFFHVVLIDTVLKGTDGIEVLRQIRDISPRTEGIIITGNATLKSSIEALNMGAFAYLIKPLDLDEVRVVVQKAMNQQQTMMENFLIKDFSENIISYIPSALLVLDRGFNVVLANKSYCEMFHTTAGDTEGKNVWEIFPVEGLDVNLERVQKGNKLSYGMELRCSSPQTGEKVFHVRTFEIPLPTITGEETRLILVIEDFTERKRLEDELIQAQKMGILGQAAARWAHEIKNPLQQICTGAQYLRKYSPVDYGERDSLEGIINGVTSLNRIVTELLDYTRPIRLNCHEVDIHNLIDGVLFESKKQLERANIQVRKSYGTTFGKVWVDGFKTKQAFQNIVRNGMDAMPDGGELTVATKLTRKPGAKEPLDVLEVIFSDTGCGIPESEIGKVFYPFHTTKVRGIGLGMAIAKNVVDLHHGEILVESKAGEGTRVIVRLPLR